MERFVTVGETIADDNPEIKQDMYDACKEARTAGLYHFKSLKYFKKPKKNRNNFTILIFFVT